MNVPFLDIKVQNQSIRPEIDEAICAVIDAGAFAGGTYVAAFEEKFAAFCETEHAVGVGSGTEALWLALLALGVGAGDEVITVPNTFIATVEAISFAGATPVFVDVDDETALMDPKLIQAAITERTKAIMPVHLYGQTADMDAILEIANRYDIPVVEDAAQAHGARYKGRRAGSEATVGCFSFYPGKNLGAMGEAGAVVTNDAGLAERVRMLRDHGQSRKYHHDVVGWNGRMDGIQGAVLSIKLEHIDEWNAARRKHAALYHELLVGESSVRLVRTGAHNEHVHHLMVARVADRPTVMAQLKEHGVGCGIHYPVPIHLTEAYADLGYGPGSFPIAERLADEVVSLPMFAELSEDQVRATVRALEASVRQPVWWNRRRQ